MTHSHPQNTLRLFKSITPFPLFQSCLGKWHRISDANPGVVHGQSKPNKNISNVGEHMVEMHGEDAKNTEKSFKALRKCRGKYECLLYKMLFIIELKLSLNKQSDSIRSKLFT